MGSNFNQAKQHATRERTGGKPYEPKNNGVGELECKPLPALTLGQPLAGGNDRASGIGFSPRALRTIGANFRNL